MTTNSTIEIKRRLEAGKITWAGPIIMLVARSVLAVVCQVLIAVIFYSGTSDTWNEAGQWWTVYGTVIDVGCLLLLIWLTKREGIRLFDLGSYNQSLDYRRIDPSAQVQTGPGLPRWQWRQLKLAWSGPVSKEQTVVLTLLAPWQNRLLHLAQILLLLALGVLLIRDRATGGPGSWLRALRVNRGGAGHA